MPRRSPTLDHLVLALHEQAAVLSPAEFGQTALRHCQPLLGFSSAVFGTGQIVPATTAAPAQQTIHAFELFEQPLEKMVARRDLRGPDPILDAAALCTGRPVTMAVDDLVASGRSDMRHYCERFGVRHSTVLIQGQAGRGVEALALWFGQRRGPGIRQQALAAQLLPHLLLARRNNARLHSLASVVADGMPLAALASMAGHLHHAPTAVLALLQRQWPQFQPPWLPQALLQALASGGFAGRHLRVQCRPLAGGLLLLQLQAVQPPQRAQPVQAGPMLAARPLAAVALTPAEARVAELVATGLSYKLVAQRLQRSPATVRNQLQSIYAKLGLRGKTALALAWRAAGTPPAG